VVVLVAPHSWPVSLEGISAHTLHTDIISTYYGCLLQTKAHIEKIFETSTILQIAGKNAHGYQWVSYGERAVNFEAFLEANHRKHKNKREIHDKPKEE